MSHPLPFSWFNPNKAIRIYRGNLPHWRQDGCLYFITYRLADSIPRQIAEAWQEDRRIWMKAHGIDGYPSQPEWRGLFEKLPEKERKMYERMNARRIFTQLDRNCGECLLRDSSGRTAVGNAMFYFDHTRWRVGDFVVMPNHVHALVQPLADYSLESTLYSVKRFSASGINDQLKRTGSVWQKEYYDHIVRNHDELIGIRKYIAGNPAKANLSDSAVTCYRATWLDDGAVAPGEDSASECGAT